MLRKTLLTAGFMLFSNGSLTAKTYTLGGERPAKLLTPTSASESKKVPLLIFLHGYTSSAEQSDSFFGISKQRDSLGFAILLPNGTKNSSGSQFWNATPECCDGEKSGVDDSGYIAALIREAAVTAPIDASRVYLIGHSNGGFMSYRMACDHPDLIRGAISISGAFFANKALCAGPGRLNLLQIHGTADSTIPYETKGGLPGAADSVKFWVESQICSSVAVEQKQALHLTQFGGSAGNETDSFVWDSCRDGAHVGLWKVNGTGHLPYFNSTWLAAALKFVE